MTPLVRNLGKKLRRAAGLPPRVLAAKVGVRLAAFPRRQIERIRVMAGAAEIGDEEFEAALSEVEGVLSGSGRDSALSFPVDVAAREAYCAAARAAWPDAEKKSIEKADAACAHVFDLLGSGEVNLGPSIDWSRDFKSGRRWPKQFYRDITQIRPDDDSDIKVTRELSRCQHFTTLGRAYWHTNDEKYAREFREQVSHWINENPVKRSVNWDCAMDVAIRAVNWLWGAAFFRRSPELDGAFRRKLLRSLLAHGRFIRENLEFFEAWEEGSWVRVNGNHYISDLAGLIFLGTLLPELKEARGWRDFGLKELWRELDEQVLPDGCCYESSVSYHRLSLEIFLSCALLCREKGIEVPREAWAGLERMLEFSAAYVRPDGRAPQSGDADDGRLQILGPQAIDDHRYLLAAGAVLFGRADFKAAAGGFHEEALWLLGPGSVALWERIPGAADAGAESRAFPEGGYYVMRGEGLYLLADCGGVGVRGHGTHDHSDPLSFELCAHGRAFIVDPGSYIYSGSPEWRNRFRSTAWHNTVRVDGEEANRFDPEDLFAIQGDARPEVSAWEAGKDHDFLDALHFGYERLADPVVHRRRIYFDKAGGHWLIRDDILGREEHEAEWFFHFGAGIPVEILEGGLAVTACAGGSNLTFKAGGIHDFKMELRDGWVSRRYGVKEPGKVLRISVKKTLPVTMDFILAPAADGGRRDVSKINIPDLMRVA